MPVDTDLEKAAKSICAAGQLQFIEYVGGGAFKNVFKVQMGGGQFRALKVIKGPASEPRTNREIQALQRCNHPNIGRLFDASTHELDGVRYD
ncbi:MAG: hypothetical protein HY706_03340 [Candidatus Hydrogenedentes bacterium]|nr:hypothetical protein [Candidatus Hydrogenedentota bacterium]